MIVPRQGRKRYAFQDHVRLRVRLRNQGGAGGEQRVPASTD
jgi:hypothetical protein